MKRLLSILSSVALLSGAAGTVVACTSKFDKKKDGNSILAYLTIDGNKVSIDSSNVLLEMINESGPSNRNKFILDILKILNTSFFVNADAFGEEVEKAGNSTEYQNHDLVNQLKESYKDIQSEAERQIAEERKKYKDDYGKKATQKWYEMLESKFKGIKDRDELDAKYLQSIIIGGNKNTTSEMLNILLNNNQLSYTFKNRIDIINQELLDLRVYTKDNKTVEDYYKDTAKKDKVLILWNASGQTKDKFASSLADFSAEDFASHFDLKKSDSELVKQNAPISTTSYAKNTTARGMISNSQRFFLDKYFNYQKPVALTEISFPFETNQKMDDGITAADFGLETGKETELGRNIETFITKDTNASLKYWDDALDAQIPSGTAKRFESLLTLDGDTTTFSNTLRSSVYDYLQTASTGNAPASGSALVDSINRTTNGKVYSVVGDGVIAFVESDGLHFVRIEGFKEFKAANGSWSSTDGDKGPGTSDKELALFDDFWNNKNDSERIAAMQNTESETYKGLNSKINNQYLKYLINTSLTKGITGSKTAYDFMSQVKNFIKVEEPSSGEGTYVWWTAILEYYEYMLGAPSTNSPEEYNEKFLSKFITFGEEGSETAQNEIALKMQSWFISHIGSAKSTAAGTPLTTHAENHKAWVKSIKAGKASNTGYPEGYIEENIQKIIDIKQFGLPSNMTGSNVVDSSTKTMSAAEGFSKAKDFDIFYNNNSYAVVLGGKR
ncbi:hypothetical protein [Spiroplasma alleghenense]|uniref:Lipoprotein n=1 Tax=Spiroplasma alleghenense TaxID=216931 RepID=A0A345Z3Z4_9MOLU|nr:hypothetical protein [Spiroplasma alleghenense]AXK51323.1 hypothetical protein SALLE_v1c06530 [Spiroplasma alleghenense]